MIEASLALHSRAAEGSSIRPASATRASFIAAAGTATIVLSIGAALLPALDHVSATTVLGLLLTAAGLLEVFAGKLRHETQKLAMLAGFATLFTGALLIFNRGNGLLPNGTVVTAWLLVRAVILLVTSRLAHGSVRKFLAVSAGTDFILGAGLLTGLSISTLVIIIFGPSPQLLASYGWVLALSFIATGIMLLEVASCEREAVRQFSQRSA
jgi:uncharacterized membrane protein HdeD (DUF308 family)